MDTSDPKHVNNKSGDFPRRLDGPLRQVHRPVQAPLQRVQHSPIPQSSAVVSSPAAIPASQPVFKYPARNKRQGKSWWKRLLMILLLLLLVGGIYFGAKILLVTSKVINRNTGSGAPALAGNIDATKLRGEGDGRINILLLGIGGAGHAGPYLSDTILVMSIDPKTKDVAMLSIPRDLWVSIPGYGNAKINAACAYGESDNYPGGCGALAKATVEKVLDLPIHYYVRVDFSAFKQAVDSVGGVDILVDTLLNDPYFPNDATNGYSPLYIPAGLKHMDGNLALRYARSRETTSDFDRALRQQKVILAIRAKALSLGTLTNPAKISGLIDTVGNHVKTDLQLFEIKKLAEIAKDLDTTKVISKVLDTAPDGLLVDHSGDERGYIELPKSGNFADIQAYAHSIFTDSYLKSENAAIEVQNGTLQAGLAGTVSKLLTGYGYNVTSTVTAAQQNKATTLIYDYTSGAKPYTIQYLEKRFGVKSQKAAPASGDPEIRIILGNDYKAPSTTNTPRPTTKG